MKKFQYMGLKIGSIIVKKSDHVELFGITIKNKLTLKNPVKNLLCNANYKLHGLGHIRQYLTVEKARLLNKVLIDSLLNYASLI